MEILPGDCAEDCLRGVESFAVSTSEQDQRTLFGDRSTARHGHVKDVHSALGAQLRQFLGRLGINRTQVNAQRARTHASESVVRSVIDAHDDFVIWKAGEQHVATGRKLSNAIRYSAAILDKFLRFAAIPVVRGKLEAGFKKALRDGTT